MISTNLSTRPFYNERLVHLILLAVVVVVAAATALNVVTIVRLSGRDSQLNAQAARAERSAAAARREAERVRRSIDRTQLTSVVTGATEANQLIDRRTFSWTTLLSDFSATLPNDVRISAVAPRFERDGRMYVDLIVVGRRAEDINGFVEKLEARGAFRNIVWRSESVNPEGLRETALSGEYVGSARRAS